MGGNEILLTLNQEAAIKKRPTNIRKVEALTVMAEPMLKNIAEDINIGSNISIQNKASE